MLRTAGREKECSQDTNGRPAAPGAGLSRSACSSCVFSGCVSCVFRRSPPLLPRAGLGHTYVWVRYACFYPVLGPFPTVFSPFFRAARLPGAKTERTRQRRRKMGEKWPKSWCRNPRNHTYTPPLLVRSIGRDGRAVGQRRPPLAVFKVHRHAGLQRDAAEHVAKG